MINLPKTILKEKVNIDFVLLVSLLMEIKFLRFTFPSYMKNSVWTANPGMHVMDWLAL